MRAQVPRIYVAAAILAASCAGFAGASGCGTAAPQAEFRDIPGPETTAVLSGPLCGNGQSCRCASTPAEAGLPTDRLAKRYEFKLGPTDNALWALVDGRVLYKSNERATECFYIDLRAGRHPVVLLAQGEHGFGARLHVSELDKRGGYATFDFSCGGPGVCAYDRLEDWDRELDKFERNVHDPCGSTKIRKLRRQAGRGQDNVHPTRLQLELELEIYDFVPEHGPGDPACRDKF